MAQTTELIKTLKQVLKAHGKTYADVARSIDLTEASIKRMFSKNSFSLNRLDQICQTLGIEISDLVQQMNERQQKLQQLTKDQEQEITDDLTLLLVTVCVLNRWTMAEIVDYYAITEDECFRKLARLDRLKIIDVLPNNRIKLLVAPNFSWIENGPIQAFFQEQIGREIFNSRFTRDDECLFVLNGMLSQQSNAEFQRKLKRLAWEFDLLNNDDAALSLDERNGVTVAIAMRGWRYGLFNPLRKDNT